MLYLRFFKGLTQSQIADQLDISQMHVSRLLAKTLAHLARGPHPKSERPVPRLLLIANVKGRSFSPSGWRSWRRPWPRSIKVQVAETKRHGHATHVARGAVHEGYDVVVAMGGDGTLNEVANGLAGSRVPLGILPGGGTNVFARSLGIPEDLFEASAILLEAANAEPRRIPLGRADGRYFVFTCGMGFDGAIVRTVERRQRLKKAGGELFYLWSGVLAFRRYDRRSPHLTVSWGPELEHRPRGPVPRHQPEGEPVHLSARAGVPGVPRRGD